MNSSPTVSNLMAALSKAQAEFPVIPKTKEVIVKTNSGSYTFKYAPLEDTIKLIRPVLQVNGLGFTQGANGDTLTTTIFHSSGEWISYSAPLPDAGTEQQYGSRITYRRRYALKCALGFESDEDDADNLIKAEEGNGKKERISANAGALDNIADKERLAHIKKKAGEIIDWFNSDDSDREGRAYEIYREFTDNEEKLALWSLLDSKMRKTLKQLYKDDQRGLTKERENATV